MAIDLNTIVNTKNVADLLNDEELSEIANKVLQGYEIDLESTKDWRDTTDRALDVAKQVMETKNFPFPNASNVKFPLITKAAIDFASRTYPELIQNGRLVKFVPRGADLQNKKRMRADNVEEFMAYQLLDSNDEWEEGTDHLLHMLPVLGTVFRKTYYDPIKRRPVSVVCAKDELVVNYFIKNLESARRITHSLHMYKNDIIERQRAGIFKLVDLDKIFTRHIEEGEQDELDESDDDLPVCILEQHCYFDLDNDGYQEPYIIVLHKETKQILRIKARFTVFDIKFNDKREVICIEPEQYFTDYHFLKSPDGGFYGLGLGALLLPINESINTLINQLIDAGKLSNTPGGFLGRGLKLKNGEMSFPMGVFKVVDTVPGSTIRDNIVPLPTKEPSPTLLHLLELLIGVGKDLSNRSDILEGKQPAQNVASTTILALIEQGMKVFNAIQKRLYRAFRSEFKKHYRLNRIFLSDKEYQNVLDRVAHVSEDFALDDSDIVPLADPSMSSDAQRLARAQALLQLPGVNEQQKVQQYLRALQFKEEEIQQLLQVQQQPDAAQQELQIKAQAEQLRAQNEMKRLQVLVKQLEVQSRDVDTRAKESDARIAKMMQDAENNRRKVDLAIQKSQQENALDVAKLQQDAGQSTNDMIVKLKALEVKLKEIEEKFGGTRGDIDNPV